MTVECWAVQCWGAAQVAAAEPEPRQSLNTVQHHFRYNTLVLTACSVVSAMIFQNVFLYKF